jgi:predicted AlkP superfamily pyrophosphatase or phosphodiesterase
MRKCLLVILALLAWSPDLAAKPLVVLVSIDGFRPDYLRRGNSPTLDGLAERGASAKGLIPAFPSVTFPNHYSIVTGLFPDRHGIVKASGRRRCSGREAKRRSMGSNLTIGCPTPKR